MPAQVAGTSDADKQQPAAKVQTAATATGADATAYGGHSFHQGLQDALRNNLHLTPGVPAGPPKSLNGLLFPGRK